MHVALVIIAVIVVIGLLAYSTRSGEAPRRTARG